MRCSLGHFLLSPQFSRQLRMSRNYNGLALPEILTRRYFFIAISNFYYAGSEGRDRSASLRLVVDDLLILEYPAGRCAWVQYCIRSSTSGPRQAQTKAKLNAVDVFDSVPSGGVVAICRFERR